MTSSLMALPRRFFVNDDVTNTVHLDVDLPDDSDEEAFGGSDVETEYDGGQMILAEGIVDGVLSDDPPPRDMRGTVVALYCHHMLRLKRASSYRCCCPAPVAIGDRRSCTTALDYSSLLNQQPLASALTRRRRTRLCVSALASSSVVFVCECTRE